ncbi:MAG: glycosyltransferase family 2 protein [Winogradskyella sp.]|uniref:glycosyltransferase family 2 protein n=1 Tax=Winogradskyella sp. TaxID=1883156 RepID=UPI0017A20AD9|nr:glycosyltransferase family 2 protein [Winogradskyella sp.]
MNLSTTLVLPTYNWPEALELVLLSLENQTQFPGEVIIADDGSTEQTKQLIDKFKKVLPIPLRHIWHQDVGSTKEVILNKAIAKAHGDYIIQIDGDCIMHKNFIQDHVSAIENNTYLFGSRVSLKENIVQNVLKNKRIKFPVLTKGLKKRGRGIHLSFLGRQYKRQPFMSKKLRGCNYSFWKEDFIAVNGYNEDMVGWGRDDTELMLRMMHNNVHGKRLKFRGIVYHIWHKEACRSGININDKIQAETQKNKLVWCNNGIDKYLSEKN